MTEECVKLKNWDKYALYLNSNKPSNEDDR